MAQQLGQSDLVSMEELIISNTIQLIGALIAKSKATSSYDL